MLSKMVCEILEGILLEVCAGCHLTERGKCGTKEKKKDLRWEDAEIILRDRKQVRRSGSLLSAALL